MKNDEKKPWWTNIEWLMFFAGMAAGISITNIIYTSIIYAVFK